jgi:sugar phosphate isomerase/epimerase
LFPASKDPEIVGIVRKRFLQAYATAKAINAKHIVFHAGYISKAYFPGDWLKTSTDFWKKFLSHTDDDIEIHIENVCEDDYLLINELIESISKPIFSACLDIGHVNVNSPKSISDWIKGLNTKIKYVHLHNNDGISDGNHGLCRGEINISNVLEMLELYAPDAKWSLETKLHETEESILWLERNGFVKR